MKKLIIASTLAVSALTTAPIVQAAIDWATVPWVLTDTSYVKFSFFGPYYKACHWKKAAYDSATSTYQFKINTTYTGKFSPCPAPLN